MDEDGYLWDNIHACLIECAIIGVSDKERGAVVKATVRVILAKGYKASLELVTELQNHVKKVTVPYKYPKIVGFVKEILKIISGKIKRKEIRERER
jgi:acetyl-CoA synthetase